MGKLSESQGGLPADCESSGQRKTMGDHRDPVHLDKMVLVVVRQGRLDCVSSCQRKPTKAKKKPQRDHQAQIHLGKMVLMVVKQRRWTAWAAAKDSQGKADKGLYTAKGAIEWPIKQGMMVCWHVWCVTAP